VEADAEDLVMLRLKMEDDVAVLCQSDLLTPGYMNYVEVQGTNGSVFTSILSHLPTTLHCREARGQFSAGQHVFEFPAVDLFARELQHFVDSCRSPAPGGLNSLDDSLRLMDVVEEALPARPPAEAVPTR